MPAGAGALQTRTLLAPPHSPHLGRCPLRLQLLRQARVLRLQGCQ